MKHFASISLVLIAGVALGFSALPTAYAQYYGGQSLAMTPTYLTIEVGQSAQFGVVMNTVNSYGQPSPQNVTYNATFNSSDQTIASNVGNASFRGNAAGRVTITATYNGQIAQATLIVIGRAPGITLQSATNVAGESATLNGAVTANGGNTSVWFEYGPTVALGSVTGRRSVGSETYPANISQGVSGLLPNTTYYYRAVAQNAYGTVPSQTDRFTTAQSGSAPAGTPAAGGSSFLGFFGNGNAPTPPPPVAPAEVLSVVPGLMKNGQLIESGVPATYPNPGETISYNLAYTNNGAKPLTNVVLNILLPSDVELTGARPAPTSLSANGLTIDLGKLFPKNGGTVNLTLRVKSTAVPGETFILATTVNYTQAGQPAQTLAQNTTVLVADPNAAAAQNHSFSASLLGIFKRPGGFMWGAILIVALLLFGYIIYRIIRKRVLLKKAKEYAKALKAVTPSMTPGGIYGQPQKVAERRSSVPPPVPSRRAAPPAGLPIGESEEGGGQI